MKRLAGIFLCLIMVTSGLFAAGGQAGSAPASSSGAGWVPTRPIDFIVPFAPGGSSDAIGRVFETAGKPFFAQPMTFINMPGGSMAIGLTHLINSRPDGYSIGTANNGIAQQPVTSDTPYDYYDVLTPIVQFGSVPYVCVVNVNSPYMTFKDLAEAIKANPNGLVSGAAGLGGGTHFEMEQLALMVGSDIKTIPVSDGGAAAIAQLLGNNIDVSVQAPTECLQHVQAGTLRALAVFGTERMRNPVLANIPTAREQGYDILSELWQGVGGPPNMDPAALKYYEEQFEKAMKDPAVIKAIEATGFEAVFLNSTDFKKKWLETYNSFSNVVKSLGNRMEP